MYQNLQSFIESEISLGGSSIYLFLLLFLAGILASLLPCVYPLYPITAGILKSRSQSLRWSHPLVYYFGMASTYLLFGLFAGISGGLLNQVFRFPETNLFLAYILFLLAISTADFLHLPIFQSRNSGTNTNRLGGSFILGMLAGLLSSPCVGPVVVSILLNVISTQNADISILSITLSTFKMFIFGLGVGFPFLMIGVFGFALPKSGKWMKYVQYGLAILILYFSYTYFEKSISGIKALYDSSVNIYILLLLLFYLIVKVQDSTLFLTERVKRSLYLWTILLLSILLFRITIITESPVGSAESLEIEQSGNLAWYRTFEAAKQKAQTEGKKIFIDFYADWCTNCKEFQKLTLTNVDLNQALAKDAILLKVYDTDPIFEEFANNPNYKELQIGLPFFLVLDSQGKMVYKTNNYLASKEMIKALQK
ncbi:cytochrome C biogenesis protein transmembrane region [Leptospira ryugenii]|uniref:Cytochrome C biogenesis protein transmembrane region n=1 Tax=Leptospira ryugenii TaxID=1917863 RepID=A0A2P2E3M9_9LEPT|nr:cytochrome c biogenesis protein CcdA [Leptospira ryugenii]GBF51481.1 cytochrome C biogenesis protein transmembrane region [Leptospira ryugenii]